ncbi:MAG: FIG001353: Acetyltransferase [uncultured Sulfurovum sp.]|uniref:FIG001353: Acetyltransferase n=1 Tax=uncultured Sulfurovum sp. TaxID=269237 RepID=A0A6S6U3B8_9BACT|nr:MAG: FIG001353: Acetyltransferase [uncultured Sulfurovum sp.]
MQSVQLDKKRHDRKGFDCGVEALNNYLKLMANQQSSKDNSRTYVLENSTDKNQIIGFYTLTMTSIDLQALPHNLQKKHQNSNSAGLIARLAVDKRYAKQGHGAWLLIDSLKKLLEASDIVGFPIIVVDAKEGASDFYKQFGFVTFLDEENRLFITVADIKSSFDVS